MDESALERYFDDSIANVSRHSCLNLQLKKALFTLIVSLSVINTFTHCCCSWFKQIQNFLFILFHFGNFLLFIFNYTYNKNITRPCF